MSHPALVFCCAGFRLGVAVFILFLNLGCSASSEKRDGAPITVAVLDDTGASIESFAVIAATDSDVTELSCPGTVPNLIACSDSRIEVLSVPDALSITIKSPGHAFVTHTFTAQELATENLFITIEAPRLQAFEYSADYATGFTETSQRKDFLALAQTFPSDSGQEYVVKFYIENLNDNPAVYFMNTALHPIHFDFVRDVLQRPVSSMDFQMQTYIEEDRKAIAGTIMFFPDATIAQPNGEPTGTAPMLVTFFPSDRLTAAHAALAHQLLEERLGFLSHLGLKNRLFYLPPGTAQMNALLENEFHFQCRGIPWISQNTLCQNIAVQILNAGEAYGTLRQMTPQQLELKTTVISFRDILLLTQLPSELPPVAGTITEELQTPLSHVNVAAMNRGTPNIALLNTEDKTSVRALIGSLVHFRVDKGSYLLEPATAEQAEAFWQRQPQHPAVSLASDMTETSIRSLSDITFNDSLRFGAKAANVAEINHVLADMSPSGFAIPFYYYEHFMTTGLVTESSCIDAQTDCLTEGRTEKVCQNAQSVCIALAGTTLMSYARQLIAAEGFSMNAALREALLDGLRYHMRHIAIDSEFAATLEQNITSTFGDARVRLRSSTNAEDLDGFSGAGLYESVSAYGSGKKKPAADQIRKVWASVWNWRAFEERSLWNMDHFSVKMGVLVNQAFEDEAANGVLITRNLTDPMVQGYYVNVQPGEASVTNPEEGTPEIFSIIAGNTSGSVQSAVFAYSSLSPDQRILSDAEIQTLHDAALLLQHHFTALYDISSFTLAQFDLEFKFTGPQRNLVIKQIRPFNGAR